MKRRADVKIRLQKSGDKAVVDAAIVKAGFGACAVSVDEVVVVDGAVSCVVVVDSAGANEAALLDAHADDDRLCNAWIAAQFIGGVCDVVRSTRVP